MKLLKGSSRYEGVHLMSGNYIKQNGLNLDYDVTVKLEQKSMMLELEVTMKRKGLRSFIENIAPPGLLVAVSWVIFHICPVLAISYLGAVPITIFELRPVSESL